MADAAGGGEMGGEKLAAKGKSKEVPKSDDKDDNKGPKSTGKVSFKVRSPFLYSRIRIIPVCAVLCGRFACLE